MAPGVPTPPAAPAAYPVPTGYPYVPPPKHTNTALIIVVVIVVVVALTVIASAVLYVMVSGLIGGPTTSKPVLSFVTPAESGMGEQITIASASQALGPANYKVNLGAAGVTGLAMPMPSIGGGFVVVTVGGAFYRVNWTDIGGERTVNGGDALTVTHVVTSAGATYTPMPIATAFVLYLLWSDGSQIASVPWTTP